MKLRHFCIAIAAPIFLLACDDKGELTYQQTEYKRGPSYFEQQNKEFAASGMKNRRLWNNLSLGDVMGRYPKKEDLKKVKYLVQMDNMWHEQGFEDMEWMFNVETISMGGRLSSLNDEHVKDFCTYKLHHLEKFIVPMSPNITIESVKMVIEAFPSLKSISVISADQITREQCVPLAEKHGVDIIGEWNFGS